MRLLLRVALVLLVLLVSSCGRNDTASSPAADAFDVAEWRGAWDQARDAYATTLTTFADQLDFLSQHNASELQLAEALQRLSGDVATEAEKFVAAVDAAGVIPEGRVDIATAVENLRAALQQQAEAYGAVVDCGPDPVCQNDRFPAVQAGQGAVGEALALIPKS